MSERPARTNNAFTHLDADGCARMVDVGRKRATSRMATAEAWVDVGPAIARILRDRGALRKGNVLETARLAGMMAAKKTADLVPLCHPLPLDVIELEGILAGSKVRLTATVKTHATTGVEMEAMIAVTIAAITVYDMVKSEEKAVQIGPIRLLEKRGGKSGHWKRGPQNGMR
jgi:cyclic pyranopterin phosphate synthase